MSEFMKQRYPLAEPGCGLTVLSMEGGEITLFGSCVKIKTTGKDKLTGSYTRESDFNAGLSESAFRRLSD